MPAFAFCDKPSLKIPCLVNLAVAPTKLRERFGFRLSFGLPVLGLGAFLHRLRDTFCPEISLGCV
jgi:hypothetical protein